MLAEVPAEASGPQAPSRAGGAAAPARNAPADDGPDHLVLGQTYDAGTQHELVLEAEGIAAVMGRQKAFVVATDPASFSVTGEAVASGWRFSVPSGDGADDDPLLVLDLTPLSIAELSTRPESFTNAGRFNVDPMDAACRLQELVALARTNAAADDYWAPLSTVLEDPSWAGVVVFNASVRVPDTIEGLSTGALAGTELPVAALGFTMPAARGTMFAVVDVPGSATASGRPVRARFTNNALTAVNWPPR